MKINISDIATLLIGQSALFDYEIEELLTDSRLVCNPAKTIFVAIRTSTNDGHAYVEELIGKGVRNFIVDHIDSSWKGDNINFIKVDDTFNALQMIGRMCRQRLSCNVIAITGSIGKTTIKELFYNYYHGCD